MFSTCTELTANSVELQGKIINRTSNEGALQGESPLSLLCKKFQIFWNANLITGEDKDVRTAFTSLSVEDKIRFITFVDSFSYACLSTKGGVSRLAGDKTVTGLSLFLRNVHKPSELVNKVPVGISFLQPHTGVALGILKLPTPPWDSGIESLLLRNSSAKLFDVGSALVLAEQKRREDSRNMGCTTDELRQMFMSKAKFRLVRGNALRSPYAPWAGYRYDGLYEVITCYRARQKHLTVWHFVMQCCSSNNPPPKRRELNHVKEVKERAVAIGEIAIEEMRHWWPLTKEQQETVMKQVVGNVKSAKECYENNDLSMRITFMKHDGLLEMSVPPLVLAEPSFGMNGCFTVTTFFVLLAMLEKAGVTWREKALFQERKTCWAKYGFLPLFLVYVEKRKIRDDEARSVAELINAAWPGIKATTGLNLEAISTNSLENDGENLDNTDNTACVDQNISSPSSRTKRRKEERPRLRKHAFTMNQGLRRLQALGCLDFKSRTQTDQTSEFVNNEKQIQTWITTQGHIGVYIPAIGSVMRYSTELVIERFIAVNRVLATKPVHAYIRGKIHDARQKHLPGQTREQRMVESAFDAYVTLGQSITENWNPWDDVSQGQELFPIPAENELDDEPPPTDFT